MALNAVSKLPPGVPEVLRAAHDVFVNVTTDRILRIETLTQAVHNGQDSVSALTEIAQIAHKIAGVAGTLGYPEIGNQSRAIEQRLKSDIAAGAPLRHWDSISAEIEALLDEMEELI